MEFEFDKEMDALLRKAARSGETRVNEVSGVHLDADEISIFAENALSEKAKPRVISHLADCDRCRAILSNTIILNSEAGEESASAAVLGEENIAAPVSDVPWYKKLFATRNLAFGLGALVVMFAGMFGFLIVQRSLNSGTMDMAKVSEDAANTASAPADAKSAPDKDATNSNSAENSDSDNLDESKSESNTAGDNAGNTADQSGGQRSAGEVQADKDNAPQGYSDQTKPGTLGNVSGEKQKADNRPTVGERSDRAQEDENELSYKDEPRKRDAPASRPAPPPAPKATPSLVIAAKPAPKAAGRGAAEKKREEQMQTEASTDSVSADDSKEANSRTVGGKTFTLKQRVWYDSNYKGQKTTNVRRKTSDYNKLDSGLRSITDKLGGTVVLVWKSKAYRVQ